MIACRTSVELDRMRRCGVALYEVLCQVKEAVKPGASTWDLEEVAEQAIREQRGTSAFRGYRGYPCVLCTSVNDEVIHGIPSRKRVLAEGEIVSLDCGLVVEGYFSDTALTVPVGDPERLAPPVRRLLEVTEGALAAAIDQARPGNRLGDISSTVQALAERERFSVVREFVGHGIGTQLHEDPAVPNYGQAGTGPRLRSGMVLAIEPMLTSGASAVRVLSDGWTAVTADGSMAAHFEHTVAITADGPWILTRP